MPEPAVKGLIIAEPSPAAGVEVCVNVGVPTGESVDVGETVCVSVIVGVAVGV